MWITAAASVIPYSARSSQSFALVGLVAATALILSTIIKPKRLPPFHQLLLSGATLTAILPITRLVLLHAGALGLFTTFSALFLVRTLLTPPQRALPLGTVLLIFTGLFHLGDLHALPHTTMAALIGLSTMAFSLVTTWWALRNTWASLGSLALLGLTAAAFLLPSNAWVSDQTNNRYSLVAIPTSSFSTGHTLLVNGVPRFVSASEIQRHSCTTAIPTALAEHNKQLLENALVLFGGDGMIVRNLLALKSVRHVKVIDPDRALQRLARENAVFRSYNLDSMRSTRTKTVVATPFDWLQRQDGRFDIIIADLPPPVTGPLKKYYTAQFVSSLLAVQKLKGIVVLSAPLRLAGELAALVRERSPLQRIQGYRDPVSDRILLVIAPGHWAAIDERGGTRFLVQHCAKAEPIFSQARYKLEDIVTGTFGGEERAHMLAVRDAARLSLPR